MKKFHYVAIFIAVLTISITMYDRHAAKGDDVVRTLTTRIWKAWNIPKEVCKRGITRTFEVMKTTFEDYHTREGTEGDIILGLKRLNTLAVTAIQDLIAAVDREPDSEDLVLLSLNPGVMISCTKNIEDQLYGIKSEYYSKLPPKPTTTTAMTTSVNTTSANTTSTMTTTTTTTTTTKRPKTP